MIQHAVEDVPNRSTGYCTDDVSRAFMVVLAKLEIDPADATADRMATIYLSFLHDAQLPDGRFHNFMSYERTWLDAVGTHDSVGRALWSLGYGMRYGSHGSWKRVSRSFSAKGCRRWSGCSTRARKHMPPSAFRTRANRVSSTATCRNIAQCYARWRSS